MEKKLEGQEYDTIRFIDPEKAKRNVKCAFLEFDLLRAT